MSHAMHTYIGATLRSWRSDGRALSGESMALQLPCKLLCLWRVVAKSLPWNLLHEAPWKAGWYTVLVVTCMWDLQNRSKILTFIKKNLSRNCILFVLLRSILFASCLKIKAIEARVGRASRWRTWKSWRSIWQGSYVSCHQHHHQHQHQQHQQQQQQHLCPLHLQQWQQQQEQQCQQHLQLAPPQWSTIWGAWRAIALRSRMASVARLIHFGRGGAA